MNQIMPQHQDTPVREGITGKDEHAGRPNGTPVILAQNGNGAISPVSKVVAATLDIQVPTDRHPLVNFWNDILGKKTYKRYFEKEDRLRRAAGHIFLLGNVAFGLLYIFWFFSGLNWSVWYVSVPFFIAEIAGLITATYFGTIIWYPRFHRPEGITWDKKPTVDVFVTTCGEPLNVLENTLAAVEQIEYPHKKVYVLDDAGSSSVKMLAEHNGFKYIARGRRSDAKAGNLNYGLSQSDGEFILTLDADQIPDKEIIARLINYFRISRLGFVQSAQRFVLPEGDPFGNSDELFYKVMQPGKDNDNAAFACGSGIIYRRAALENIGGFSTWNLVEDVHTSMKLHASGWKSIYHNHALTTGTAPADIHSVYKQRQQWATDSLRLFFWDSPFKYPGLTLKQKLQYFQLGFVYLISGFAMPVYFLIPAWSLLTGQFLTTAPVTEYVFYRGLYFLFAILALTILEHPADSRKPYKIWAGLFPIFAKATVAALRAKTEKPVYSVNRKLPDNPSLMSRFKAILPQMSIILLTLGAIAYSIEFKTLPRELFMVNTLWGCWVIWSLSAICSAALKRKKFAQNVGPA
jgi:cellulose synthase/poly-beta-1,6-N-acetylglucosamine synthase-like glycosyltransferase